MHRAFECCVVEPDEVLENPLAKRYGLFELGSLEGNIAFAGSQRKSDQAHEGGVLEIHIAFEFGFVEIGPGAKFSGSKRRLILEYSAPKHRIVTELCVGERSDSVEGYFAKIHRCAEQRKRKEGLVLEMSGAELRFTLKGDLRKRNSTFEDRRFSEVYYFPEIRTVEISSAHEAASRKHGVALEAVAAHVDMFLEHCSVE